MGEPGDRPSGRPVTVGIEGRFRRAVGRYDRRSGRAIAMLDAPAFIFGIAEALDLLRHMVPGLIVVRRGRGSGPYGDVDIQVATRGRAVLDRDRAPFLLDRKSVV